jgi:hypothetical protein
MAHEVDYWDPDVIPEDWHMFLKCFYHLDGEVDTETMYTPIHMDGIRSRSYLRTFPSYFDQVRRHAWGCTDIPYAAKHALDRPGIPAFHRFGRLGALCQSHLLWSTQWFLVTGGRAIPALLVSLGVATLFNQNFRDYVALIAEADRYLYQSKGGGRNRVSAVCVPTLTA